MTTIAWLGITGVAQATDFAQPPTSPEGTGGLPTETVVEDFNNDNRLDLATANANGDDITINLGDGTGNFDQPATSPEAVTLQIPNSITAADFNGDGKMDLAAAAAGTLSGGDEVQVLLGDGTGNFTTQQSITLGATPLDVVAGDFNSDNKMDLATADKDAGSITILLGDGAGGFSKPAASPIPTGGRPYRLAVGDFNGDTKNDLAATTDSPDGITILLQGINGSFNQAAGSPKTIGGRPYGITTGDFNSDTKTDIAATMPDSDRVAVLLGSGIGTFTEPATSPETVGESPVDVVSADFDGDGKPDLAVADNDFDFVNSVPKPGNVTVLMGAGTGNFTAAATSPEASSDGTTAIAKGDFDRDGHPDLVVTNYWGANLTILLNQTDNPPTAVGDSKTVAEDDPATTIDVVANDTDTDGGPKKVSSTTAAGHGIVTVTNSGADLTYKPAADFCGPDSFQYSLDGGSSATVAITVTCVDDPPSAVNDSKTLDQDDPATTIDVLVNDTDIDAGPKSVASKTDGAHGTVAITNSGADLTYTPAVDYCGPDSFTYTLAPGGASATVNITVSCVNAAPRNVSAGSGYTISEGDSLTLDGSATDRENDPLTYAWDLDGDGAFDDASGATPTIKSAELVGLGIADGPSTHQIKVRASDGALDTTSTAAAVTLRNTAPALQITGSADGLSDKSFDFTLTATDPSPADQSGQFSFAIDDGADGSVDETSASGSPFGISRSFGDRGSFTLAATAADKDAGTSAPATISLRLASLRKACKSEPDKLLFGSSLPDKLKGTSGNDLIATQAGNDTISSKGGDDCVKAGKGDDRIKAGPGEDAIFGQVGNDVIDTSKPGDGLAICGPGKDTAIVGPGDDTKGCERIRRRG